MATHSEDFTFQAFRKHFAELVEAIQVLNHSDNIDACLRNLRLYVLAILFQGEECSD